MWSTTAYAGLRAILPILIVAHAATIAAATAPNDVAYLARTENEPLIDIAFSTLKEVYGRVGISVVEKNAPGERAVVMVNSGEVYGDVMHVSGLESHYPNLIRIPVAVIQFDAVAFTAGKDILITGWSGLAQHPTCIRRGIKAIEFAMAGQKHVTVVSSYQQIFSMLKAGRCDIAVLPRNAWLEVERLNISGLRSMEPPLQSWPLYHYVHKSHADIVPILTRTLLSMEKTGQLTTRQDAFWKHVEDVRRAYSN